MLERQDVGEESHLHLRVVSSGSPRPALFHMCPKGRAPWLCSQPPSISVFEEGKSADSYYDHIILSKPNGGCNLKASGLPQHPETHLTQTQGLEKVGGAPATQHRGIFFMLQSGLKICEVAGNL